MTVTSTQILEQVRPEDKNLLQSKTLVRKFGKEEDCVELHVYDLNNNLLDRLPNTDLSRLHPFQYNDQLLPCENEDGLLVLVTVNEIICAVQ